MVEAGIAQGFHDEVPSMDDVAYAFDQAQRQLLEEANRFDASNLETSSKIAAKTQSRRTQTESSTDGEEVSFMIVSAMRAARARSMKLLIHRLCAHG